MVKAGQAIVEQSNVDCEAFDIIRHGSILKEKNSPNSSSPKLREGGYSPTKNERNGNLKHPPFIGNSFTDSRTTA